MANINLRLRRDEIIWEYERGLLYKDGRFEMLLEPGRYKYWRWEKVRVQRVSMRQMSQAVNSQSILTKDKIEVRITLVAQFQVTDPVQATHEVESYTDRLYQDLQLGLRDLVAGYEVDELLETRSEIGDELFNMVAESARSYGVEVLRVGIRDIVLPGAVRNVFMKEVEADRQGRADLVKARHEVAAARARANTAKILSQNPNIARLQEIDALVKLAGRQGSVVLLPGMADLLSFGKNNGSGAEGGD